MFLQLLKEANNCRACSVEELPGVLRALLGIQFMDFLNILETAQWQAHRSTLPSIEINLNVSGELLVMSP